MPTYFLIRLASILIVLLVSTQAPNNRTWVALVYSFGFTHYVMALIYSKRQFSELLAQPLALLTLLSVTLFGAGLYLFQFPLLVFFAVHHAFNEAYVLKEFERVRGLCWRGGAKGGYAPPRTGGSHRRPYGARCSASAILFSHCHRRELRGEWVGEGAQA